MRRLSSIRGPALGKRSALRVAGVVIVLCGMASAAIIWHEQDLADKQAREAQLANPMLPLATSDSTKQSREVEIYYGKTGVLMERWSEILGRMLHGKGLAATVAVISLVFGSGFFFLCRARP